MGYSDQEELASVDRKIKDGILFRVAISVAGRRCVALIDSGASQSYISPEIVTLCELHCSPTLIHLELADGSKVRSTQQTQAVPCIVGNSICQITFTVTKLLSNVDVVLGMDWLMRWNPVIDWRKQSMYLYVNRQWDQVNGVLLDGTQSAGTVKIFETYRTSEEKEVPDWTIVQRPKLWHQRKAANNVVSMNEDNEILSVQFLQAHVKDKKRASQILYQ